MSFGRQNRRIGPQDGLDWMLLPFNPSFVARVFQPTWRLLIRVSSAMRPPSPLCMWLRLNPVAMINDLVECRVGKQVASKHLDYEMTGRHSFFDIARCDLRVEFAVGDFIRNNDVVTTAILERAVFRIESQLCLARGGFRPVAMKTVLGQDRLDVAVKVDFVGMARICGAHQKEKEK